MSESSAEDLDSASGDHNSVDDFYQHPALSEDAEIRLLSSHRDQPGKYAIVPVLDKSRVDGGDSLTIRLLMTGSGKIEGAKLFISLAAQDLLVENKESLEQLRAEGSTATSTQGIPRQAYEDSKIGGWMTAKELDTSQLTASIEDGEVIATMDSDHLPMIKKENALVAPSSSLTFSEDVFAPIPENVNIDNLWEDLRPILSEMYWGDEDSLTPMQGDPLAQIELNIKEDPSPGDYEIFFTLTYFNGAEFLHDKQALTIHVDSWVERNRTWLQWLAVGIPIGILIVSVLNLTI